MNEKIKTRVALACFVFSFLFLFVGAIIFGAEYSHEKAHQEIYKKFGVESDIDMNLFGPSYTKAENGSYCNDFCKLAQSNVENNYEITMFFFGVMFFQILTLVAIIFKPCNT